ncbi:MAG: hypothetical protein ACOC6H_04075 [Thermoproteota archaeon]
MNKKTLALIATVLLTLAAIAPILSMSIPTTQAAEDSEDWYTTINGVLTTDSYELYPYEQKSIDFGLSKYGEMIDYDGEIGVGLQYPGYDAVGTHDQREETSRDAFGNEYVDPDLWLNGWVMDIRYTHRTNGDRRILSMAMFSDMNTYGGDWIVGHGYDPDTEKTTYNLDLAPYGGRKTTGYAETEDLQVLYDGPRKWVGISTTHIYDWKDGDGDGVVDHPDETWAILDLKLTFIFNKVKKEVIILKDVKKVISGKSLDSPIDVQLSNREEWDLGPKPEFASYAHFYHQNMTTCYGINETSDWHMADAILRENVETGYGLSNVTVLKGDYGPPIASGSVRVYVNGEFMTEGEDYTIDYETGAITWDVAFDYEEDWVEVVYKLRKGIITENGEELYGKTGGEAYQIETEEGTWEPFVGVPHLYDVAQIISSDKKVVGWKAYWPTLSDYTVDGWDSSLDPLVWVEQPDMVPTSDEPEIPFTIGEWDFQIGKDYPAMFRGVEVTGLTDYDNAEDEQMGEGYGNELDREVKYQLDEVFNPWDLNDALTEDTAREVDFFDVSTSGSQQTFTVSETPVLDPEDYTDPRGDPKTWYSYCSNAERVLLIRGGTETLLTPGDYSINYANGEITIHISLYSTDRIKVLYSTDTGRWPIPEDGSPVPGRWEWGVVGRDAASVDSMGLSMVSAAMKNKGIEYGLAGEDMYDPELANRVPWVMAQLGEGDTFEAYRDEMGRAYIKDDWCESRAVSSSNMLFIGGAEPNVNLGTYYFNDFTDVASDFTGEFTSGSPWEGTIFSTTCWNKNTYTSNESIGYAVISTYKDINGTVGLSIYGHWGRDTYYATQWFLEEGAYQLQEAPDCLTSIVLEIDYSTCEPTFGVSEGLGTISEIDWTHEWSEDFTALGFSGSEDKGGIHDP